MTTSNDLLPTQTKRLTNGFQLRYALLGAGPPLVLLHGYPENLQVWSRVARRLADRFRVMAFDWPGMGYSEEWPGGATPQRMASRLLSILDEWQIEAPTIAGLDMGGQPALAFAAEYPHRIERLVVLNSLVFGDEQTSWEIRWLRKFGFNRFALRHCARIIFRRAESTFLPSEFQLDRETRRDFWNAFRQLEVRKFISKMCAGYQGMLPRLPDLYATIDCPSLILWAERDKHFPLIQAERLHASLTASQLDVITGGTHWMTLAQPDAVADAIRRWMPGT